MSAATSPFTDIAGTTFEADIDWLYAEGVTEGCTATTYCPNDPVTRGHMASFLVRKFDLTDGGDINAFTDDDGTTHEADINKLAHAGITEGCNATNFCPGGLVSRGSMATFLARAIPLTDGAGNDYFRDDDGTTHEADIDRAAAAGISTGCALLALLSRNDDGGIRISTTPSTITNSTISGNSGGIAGEGVSGSPSALDVKNTIVAGKSSVDVSGTITLKLASIVGIPTGLTLTDILDPAGLADHGGPTMTIALTDVAKNPAIDKGDAATCAAGPVNGLDQRGLSRTPPCDIGAFEHQP